MHGCPGLVVKGGELYREVMGLNPGGYSSDIFHVPYFGYENWIVCSKRLKIGKRKRGRKVKYFTQI